MYVPSQITTVPPLVRHLVYFATERLTLKQAKLGSLLIGGGWPSREDGSGRRTLTPQNLDFHPAWSPDGRRIAFQREATLYLMNADGSHVRRLTARAAIDGSPAWRPAAA